MEPLAKKYFEISSKMDPKDLAVLREYFQHVRDQELGRWRDPEDPFMVVYPTGTKHWLDGRRSIFVLNERKVELKLEFERNWKDSLTGPSARTAERYFEEHPIPPWHYAKPGEVWAITAKFIPEPELYKVSNPFADGGVNFTHVHSGKPLYGGASGPITSARRIWPEEEAQDD